ncbi:putative armadillo-like helical protein [Rosa chinensis]|uniref:Putative armadillo-like helical protein n=1 Tax=Rosa chinensis TaxID=74649 RepID=A0A2P6QTI0_ROSCH|nr:putative armadillo-like helical protein [Rosa chinensis]
MLKCYPILVELVRNPGMSFHGYDPGDRNNYWSCLLRRRNIGFHLVLLRRERRCWTAVVLKLLVHTLVSLSIRIRIHHRFHHSNTTRHHRHHNRSPKILNFTLRLVVWEELRRLRASKQTPAGQVDNPLKFGSLPSSTHEIIPATIKASSSVVSSSNGNPIITSLNTGLNLSHHEVGTEPLAFAISTISTATLVCSDKSEEVVSGANTSCVTSSETKPNGVALILYRVYAKVVHIRMASLTAVKCIPTVAIRFLIQKVEAATSIWIALHDPEKSVTKAVEDFWDCYGNDFGTDYLGLFKACSHVHYTVRYPAAEVLAAALDKFPDSIQESLSTLLLMYVCDASLSENNVNTGWLKVDSEMVMCSADAQSDAKLWPWFILCLQLYHGETKKSILVYREAFNQMGEMSQTTLSHNGPTLAGKDNLIGIVAIIDWFRCALSEFGTVAALNAWLNDNFLCLPLENKPEKMTLFLADKLEKMGHKRLLTKSAAVMFVNKDGKYVALGSKDVDTFVVVIKKMEHEFIELRNHFLSQGVVNLLEEVSELAFAKFGPSVILLTGLQGIGKTTIFTTLKMAFLLCQVALTRMGKLQDERFLFSGSFSYDNYACFDIVMAKQLPNAACHSILFRLILGALRQESSEALRRWQYALLLSSFQYCQHMLDLDIPSTVLQFLLLDEQEVEDLDLQKISREQAEVAHGNFFILRKKAQSVLDLVINDSTQGCEIGEMMSLYILDAIICVDHDGVHSQNSMQQQAQTLEAELALLLKIKYLFASFISRDEDYYACVEGREIISNLSITAASKFLLNLLVQPEHEHRKWSAAISVGLISIGLYITDHKQKFEKCLGVVKSTFKRNQSFHQLYLPYVSVGKAFTSLPNEYQIDQVDVKAVIAIVIIQLHSNEATELCKGMDKLLQAFGIYIAFAYLAYHLCSVGPQLLIEQFIDVAFVGNFYDTNVDQWLPAHDERFICKGTKRISRRLLTLLQNPFANVRMGMMTPSCTSNDKLGVHEATKTDQLADKDNVSFHQWGITFVIFYFEFVYHFFMSQCCWYNILVKMLHMVDFFQDAPHAPRFDSEYET